MKIKFNSFSAAVSIIITLLIPQAIFFIVLLTETTGRDAYLNGAKYLLLFIIISILFNIRINRKGK